MSEEYNKRREVRVGEDVKAGAGVIRISEEYEWRTKER